MPLSDISNKDLLDNWLDLECNFSNNHYNSINQINNIEIGQANDSSRKILFCAPHAFNHFRYNKIKVADIFTGSLCQVLAKATGQSGIVSTCPDNNPDYMGFGYKYLHQIERAVSNKLLIVDLHGMSNKYGLDVCIGVGANPSIRVNQLVKCLMNDLVDYRVSINEPFAALAEYTITNFVQTKLLGDAVQIEIASKLRDPTNNPIECGVFLRTIAKSFSRYLAE